VYDQLRLLIDLQTIDTTILAVFREIETLPMRLAPHEAALKSAEAVRGQAEQAATEADEQKRAGERDIMDAKDRVAKLKARAGEIKKNTEYQAHLAEVERSENALKSLEEAAVKIAVVAADAVARVAEQQKRIDEEHTAIEQERQAISRETAEKNAIVKRYKGERKRIVQNLEPDINEHYMTLMKIVRGNAVVESRDGICLGCNLHIPPQLFVEIKSGDSIENCPQCRRILYYIRAEDSGTAAPIPSDTESAEIASRQDG